MSKSLYNDFLNFMCKCGNQRQKGYIHKIFFSVEGGELFDRVVNIGQFEEPTAKLLFYQMVVAIKVNN